MNYRSLGRTGLQVSEVGFGGAGIGHVWGPTTDEDCIAAVRRALDLGINFFDTSPMYGGGRSETNLGLGLAGRREEAIVATKTRLQTEEDRANQASMVAAVRNSVEQSLARLGTDYVDILQVHHQVGAERGQYMAAVGPPPRYALLLDKEDCMALGAAMQELVTEGKVRFIGITAWDGNPAAIREILASGQYDTAQILYNLVNRTAVAEPPSGFDDIDQGRSLDRGYGPRRGCHRHPLPRRRGPGGCVGPGDGAGQRRGPRPPTGPGLLAAAVLPIRHPVPGGPALLPGQPQHRNRGARVQVGGRGGGGRRLHRPAAPGCRNRPPSWRRSTSASSSHR